jgi:hypothetical protein
VATALPTHLRSITVEIPRTWTSEQALAVFEILDDLREKVWALHGGQIQAELREQRRSSRTEEPGASIAEDQDDF